MAVSPTPALEPQANVGRDELEDIGVARQDDGVHPPLRGHIRQGPDNVVGLEAVQLQRRHAQDVHQAADPGELEGELLRRLRPPGLVFGVHLVPEGRARPVESDGPVGRLHVGPCLQEHVGEAEDRADGLPGGADVERHPRGEGVIGPIDNRVAVHHHENRTAGKEGAGLGHRRGLAARGDDGGNRRRHYRRMAGSRTRTCWEASHEREASIP